MDFDYSEDQKALKDEARRFLLDAAPTTVARGVLDAPERGMDADLWQRIGEQGWCGAAIPEAYGGHEFGYVELCALAEELGRSLAPVPFASSVYQYAEALLTAGSEQQKQDLLPGIASGEAIGTLALSEGIGTVSPARLTTRYENGVLHGEKLPVIDGMAAGRAVVLAMAADGPRLVVTSLAGDGVTREALPSLDPTRGIARIVFDGARAEPLGDGEDGFGTLARIHDRAAVLVAFEQLGGADRALEMARDYALERYAFGRPIGSYQAIKHKLADVFVRNEVARASAYYGAWALASDAPELPVAAAAARIAGCNAFWLAAKENIQTHGGIGFTWEADCHLYYRRSKHLGLAIGSVKEWKRKLTDRLEVQQGLGQAEGESGMNFEDNREEAAYRATVREWIAANKPDLTTLPPEQRLVWTDGHKNAMREWHGTKAAAGYACITWPKERGGAGGTQIEDVIFSQEETAAGVHDPYYITGLKMLLPTLMQFNDDAKSMERVPPAVRGEEIWCQLFSEPSSGSDSAGLRTMAVRDGDEWVINGQKVWNSGAAHSDYGMLITRTDPDQPKHKGLTAFWLKMDTPGLEVRPIKTMGGDSELNEVFIDDMRLPDDQRVGEVNDGWSVVISTLMSERAAIGQSAGLTWSNAMELATSITTDAGNALDDTAFRDWLADLYVDLEARRLIGFRILTAISRGEPPGPEGSAAKLLWSGGTQALMSEALDMMGPAGLIQDSELSPRGGAWQQRFLWSAGLRIGGGTDEIQKNIIAERVLGLPADVRVDKGVAFRDIPTGR